MPFITVPVYWYKGDPEQDENLKKDSGCEIGDLIVNTDHIVAYHEDDEGQIMLRLSNGDVFRTPMDFEQFCMDYPAILAQFDLFISTEN